MNTEELFTLMQGAVAYRLRYPDMRIGQALSNALHDCDPDTRKLIQNTQADPFYDDRHIPAFWAAIT